MYVYLVGFGSAVLDLVWPEMRQLKQVAATSAENTHACISLELLKMHTIDTSWVVYVRYKCRHTYYLSHGASCCTTH